MYSYILFVVILLLEKSEEKPTKKSIDEKIKAAFLPNGTQETLENLNTIKTILTRWNNRQKLARMGENYTQEQEEIEELLANVSNMTVPLPNNSSEDDTGHVNHGLESYLYQGDILLSVDQAESLVEDHHRTKRNKRQSFFPNKVLWPKQNTIYYTIGSVGSNTVAAIRYAVAFWQRETCLNIQESQNRFPRIRFVNGEGCWSYVGRQPQMQSQDISLGRGCDAFGTAAHELAHSLGVLHTQVGDAMDRIVPYDFGSVMQYSPYAFANNRQIPTVLARDWRYQTTMGQRTGPTFSDVKTINAMYRCNERCSSSISCLNGGYEDSRDCGNCKCPPQFTGKDCSLPRKGTLPVCNGDVLKATRTWQSFRGQFGYSDGSIRMEVGDCIWHVEAPIGERVHMRLHNTPTSFCTIGCDWQAVEINTDNFDVTGMRFCCTVKPQVFTSKSNTLTIRGVSRKGLANFDIYYYSDANE